MKQSGKLEHRSSLSGIMEEKFQGGVCSGSWWNPSRNLFGLSPCSASEWLNPTLIIDTKAAKTISGDSGGSASDGGSSVVLQEAPQPQLPQLISNGNLPIDSTFEMMADGWNQDFLNDSARSQQNYSLNSTTNCRQKIADEWTTVDSSHNSFGQNFLSEQQPPQSSYSATTQSAAVLPLNTASYNYTSSLLHTLFDADSEPLLEYEATNYSSSSPNFLMNSAGVVPDFLGAAMKPSFPKQQLPNNFQFVNNANFWSATAAASSGEVRASFLPSSTPQLIPSALTKPKHNQKNVHGKSWEADSAAKRGGNEPPSKRPRMETPSPLPTFKVRKEKLGDRVTALQQLVSPFGKTDTASVLHEAIDYIKLLHDQVNVLSTPYRKNCPPPLQRQQATDRIKDHEEPKKDLRSRGLCLVPISSTFPMATETTADFWTPAFGASFR